LVVDGESISNRVSIEVTAMLICGLALVGVIQKTKEKRPKHCDQGSQDQSHFEN